MKENYDQNKENARVAFDGINTFVVRPSEVEIKCIVDNVYEAQKGTNR